jgi:hypothetical protein
MYVPQVPIPHADVMSQHTTKALFGRFSERDALLNILENCAALDMSRNPYSPELV